jgi:hypothetical protein
LRVESSRDRVGSLGRCKMSSSSIGTGLVRKDGEMRLTLTGPKLLSVLNQVDNTEIKIRIVHGFAGSEKWLGVAGRTLDPLKTGRAHDMLADRRQRITEGKMEN